MQIKKQLTNLLQQAGVKSDIEFTKPPKSEMGDLAFPCFDLAKVQGKKPNEVAKEIVDILRSKKSDLVTKVELAGPYVNFHLNPQILAKLVLQGINKDLGKHNFGKGKKIMVEFAHPNTHKAFHIGHLRNAITGESLVRILENAGYKVVRANYQGDVGMHIAKCLYAIFKYDKDGISNQQKMSLAKRIKYLGDMYARGSQEFEESETVRVAVGDLNSQIYLQDKAIQEVYKVTRTWSLEYFDKIYQRLDTHFDRLYFESEVFAKGKEIVLEFLKKGVFKESDGAIIFAGSQHGLHDRVFVNSKGYPTYEAKDLALAKLQFKEFKPDRILHVVAREQLGYFQVMFKALEKTLPKSQGKEEHLVYGWVSLKEGKMSSRTGQVVLGEWLLDEIEKKILQIMKENQVKDKAEVAKKITLAAVKYSFLKTGIANDIKFDMAESISTAGDSGPYLLYIVARINSILKKAKVKTGKLKIIPKVEVAEKQLLLQLAKFSEVTEESAKTRNPAKIAQYLFDLAQNFNSFYEKCPVLKAEGDLQVFRVNLIKVVEQVMERGLYLLGIQTVDEM